LNILYVNLIQTPVIIIIKYCKWTWNE